MDESSQVVRIEPDTVIEIPLTRKLLNGVIYADNLERDLRLVKELQKPQIANARNNPTGVENEDEDEDEDDGSMAY